MKTINIKNKKIGKNQPIFIVAEVACSHDGSMDIIKKIIDGAVDANADAINFQLTHVPDYMVPGYSAGGISEGKDERDIYKYLNELLWFWKKEWKKIFEYTKSKGILISVTCNDLESAKLGIKLDADILQIHSSSLSEKNLIKLLARTKKPITLKIGGTRLGEIEKTISWVKEEGNEDIILLHGYQNYPTKLEDINFNFIPTLEKVFDVQVGFCDHTDGGEDIALVIPLLAIPTGVTLLEKHITHDRSKKCEDFESSLDPERFQKFVRYVRDAEKTLGDSSMRIFSEDEIKYRNLCKKRAVLDNDLVAGSVIKKTDIVFKRANVGLFPDESAYLIGRKLKKDTKKNTPLTWGHIE